MPSLLDLPTPSIDATCAERIAWAGERTWDFADGLLTREQAGFYCTLIAGWCDLCTESEREQYRGAYRQLNEMLRGEVA